MNSESAFFLTITYDEENQPVKRIDGGKFGTLDKKHYQDFMKRLRKRNDELYDISNREKRKVKYYAVGEYGSQTFRPHYHAIITNLQPAVLDELSKIWGKGHVSVGTPDVAAIHYTTKYVIQPTGEDIWTPLLPPFSLISKGMGKAYLYTNGRYHKETQQNFVFTDRGKVRLPRYYGNEIFNHKERVQALKASRQQDNILYWKTILEIQEREGDPYLTREKIIHDRHELIMKSIKEKENQNKTI